MKLFCINSTNKEIIKKVDFNPSFCDIFSELLTKDYMKRYINQLVNFILLTFVPMEARAIDIFNSSLYTPRFYPHDLNLFSNEELEKLAIYMDYDQILDLINKIKSNTLEESYNPEMLEIAINTVIELARKGALSNDPIVVKTLEQEIEELMHQSSLEDINTDEVIYPAIFYDKEQHLNLTYCKSWFKKKCQQVEKFVRGHEKEILIVAIVDVSFGAAIFSAESIFSAAGCAGYSFNDNEDSNSKAPSLNDVINEQVVAFQELVIEENFLSETPNHSIGDISRELGAYLAHEILDGVAEIPSVVPNELRVMGHKKINQIFSTNIGMRLSKDWEASFQIDNFDSIRGLLTNQKEIVDLNDDEVNPVRGWNIEEPVNNLTTGGKIPTWTTVRRRFWKNEAYCKPEGYSASNLERMQKGLPPQRHNPSTDQLEFKELHYISPQEKRSLFNVIGLWPNERKAIDKNS